MNAKPLHPLHYATLPARQLAHREMMLRLRFALRIALRFAVRLVLWTIVAASVAYGAVAIAAKLWLIVSTAADLKSPGYRSGDKHIRRQNYGGICTLLQAGRNWSVQADNTRPTAEIFHTLHGMDEIGVGADDNGKIKIPDGGVIDEIGDQQSIHTFFFEVPITLWNAISEDYADTVEETWAVGRDGFISMFRDGVKVSADNLSVDDEHSSKFLNQHPEVFDNQTGSCQPIEQVCSIDEDHRTLCRKRVVAGRRGENSHAVYYAATTPAVTNAL